jgi:hypothetical protein
MLSTPHEVEILLLMVPFGKEMLFAGKVKR